MMTDKDLGFTHARRCYCNVLLLVEIMQGSDVPEKRTMLYSNHAEVFDVSYLD